jgi:hypothetical protein
VLFFLSKEATGLLITDTPEYLKLGSIVVLTGVILFAVSMPKVILFKQFLLLTLILTAAFTLYSEKPKQQSPENSTISQIADWYTKDADKSKPVLYDHSLILFYGNIFGDDKERFKILNMKALEESPQGTIVIWDSHYSYRPEYKNDTKLEFLQNNSKYKLLKEFMSQDRRFAAFIFQKQ